MVSLFYQSYQNHLTHPRSMVIEVDVIEVEHKFSTGFKSGGFGGQTSYLIRVLVTNPSNVRNFVVVFVA